MSLIYLAACAAADPSPTWAGLAPEQEAHCSMLRWKALTERKKSDRSPLQLMKATIFKWKSTYKLDRTQLLWVSSSFTLLSRFPSFDILFPWKSFLLPLPFPASIFSTLPARAFSISNSRQPNNLFDYSSLTMRCCCTPPDPTDPTMTMTTEDFSFFFILLHFSDDVVVVVVVAIIL